MARREWAERIVEDLEFIAVEGDRVCESKDVLNVLTKEHARAVRIVKREIRRGTVLGSLDNVLAALMKGRA